MELSARHKKFADLFILTGNAKRSYIEAGYNVVGNTAEVNACRLLKNEKVKNYIDSKLEKVENERLEVGRVDINKFLLKKLLKKTKNNYDEVRNFIEKAILEKLPEEELTIEDIRFLMRRNPICKETRYSVLERAGFKCQACGDKPNKENDVVLHIDHIIPYSLGGSNNIDNLQVLCASCNVSKSNKSMYNHNNDWFERAE